MLWLIFVDFVTIFSISVTRILAPDWYLESSLRGWLLLLGIPHVVILLSVWIYLRRKRASWTRLLGSIPLQSTCLRALKLLPVLVAFGLGEMLVLFYSLSHLAPPFLDAFLSYELFVSAANEQQQWVYNLVTMFRVLVLGPVAKEGLFRGLLLHRWAVKWNLTAALWTSSILFGIAHTSTSVIGNTVFGLVMAILYLETGSLLVPVVVHAANNAIGCLRLWALPVAWNSVADIRDLLWLGILLLVVSAPLMLLYFSKHWPRKSVSLPYFRTATYSAAAGNPEGLSQI